MKKKTASTLIFLLFYSLSVFCQTEQIIIKLKDGITLTNNLSETDRSLGNQKIDDLSQKFNAISIRKLYAASKSSSYTFVIRFPQGTDIQQVINEYYRTGEIEYAEPDHIGSGGGILGFTPNDPFFHRQWGLKNDGTFSLSTSTAGADIDMENAWDIEQGDSNIVVAIIDSGVKADHPEFSERMWVNYGETPNNGTDDDDNGYQDDIIGWDFANSDNNPADDLGHGTNVAGIIGAGGNNEIGYAGVDWNCKLMILKGLDDENFGYYSWWADALHYATDNGAKVINMSLGGSSTSTTLRNAINYALDHNVVVVACMMNTNSNTVFYPAGYPGVIAVGSTNPDDTRSNPFFWNPASGSNYGDHISVSAPGNYVYGLSHLSNTNYNSYWGGTSQATPLVTGLASLLIAQDGDRTPSEIKSIIEASAEDLVGDAAEDIPGWDPYYGHGRVNAYSALNSFTAVNRLEGNDYPIMVYPNPTNENFTVLIPTGWEQMQIFNSLGELVFAKNMNGQNIHNVQIMDQGIYFIQIKVSDRTITKKIVIEK